MPPLYDTLHTFGCTPICSDAPWYPHMFQHPHMSQWFPCASVCSWGYLHVIGGCEALHLFGHPHVFGCLPMCPNTPTHLYAPLHVYVLGVIACTMGEHPICWGLGGLSTSVRLLVSVSTSIGCPLCFILYLSCSSLCLKSLLPLLQLLLLQWLWCLLVCHLYHQWPWLPLWWGFLQCWVSMMWFCHHPWHQEALEVFLAMPLCHSSNLHLWCLFRPVPIMPWVLHR